jgi:hypothetical protein
MVTMLLVLLMTAFFTAYLSFDPMDWSTWGPFAAVLGIIVKTGIHHTHSSADRGLLRQLRQCIMDSDEEADDNSTDVNGNDNNTNGRSSTNSLQGDQELQDWSRPNATNV